MKLMKKGISTIIATILLLIITISLAGTAYLFMNNMLNIQMSRPISVLGASCNSTLDITLVISNDGVDPIKEGDIDVFIGSEDKGQLDVYIPPKETNVSSEIKGTAGSNDVRIISPSNAIEITVWC